MKSPKIKIKIFALGLFVFVAVFNLWSLRPVKIIYTSRQMEGSNDVVVNHFPLTDRDRVYWYLDHKEELLEEYNIPRSTDFDIVIWDVADGFVNLEENYKHDLYCFRDMKVKNNCIEKNMFLKIKLYKYGKEVFTVGYSGYSYAVDKEGKLVAERDEELLHKMRRTKD